MSTRQASIALLFGMVTSACAAAGEEDLVGTEELAVESCDVRYHSMDADLVAESLLLVTVPAANVESYVPAPFQLLRLPAVAGGQDAAVLWMLAGDITSIVMDGVEGGHVHAGHIWVQIQEPAAPAGFSNSLGAAHLYELEFLVDNNAVGNWFASTLGGSAFTSHQMEMTRVAPRLLSPGVLTLDVDGNPHFGRYSYYVEHGALLPGPAPVVHGWLHGDEGLVRWDPVMSGSLTPALDGEVCTDDLSALRDIFGTRCRKGTGFMTSIHVDSTYNVWPCL